MSKLQYKLFYRHRLPHIQPPGAVLFVTFRLAGSIPAHVRRTLLDEQDTLEKAIAQIEDPVARTAELYAAQKRLFGRWDHALDLNESGPDWLRQEAIAGIVVDALHFLHGRVYDLDTFCVMSNHVHVVFSPLEKEDGSYHALSAIMHSLKRHSARQANKSLGREGKFWQHESYDHVARDEAELRRIRRYVLDNPVRVGLVDDWRKWPWSFCRPCQEE